MIDSVDRDRDVSAVLCFSASSFPSGDKSFESSGSSKNSSGEPLPENDDVLPSFLHCERTCSADMVRGKDDVALPLLLLLLGGGIAVTASRAATAGGSALGSCTSLDLLELLL